MKGRFVKQETKDQLKDVAIDLARDEGLPLLKRWFRNIRDRVQARRARRK